jgi:hypothetical protein
MSVIDLFLIYLMHSLSSIVRRTQIIVLVLLHFGLFIALHRDNPMKETRAQAQERS